VAGDQEATAKVTSVRLLPEPARTTQIDECPSLHDPRRKLYIPLYMHVLIDLDPDTYRRLERVAPAKSRRRSAFIRAAIQKSLWEREEEATRRAYLDEPDLELAAFDPTAWEPLAYGGFEPPALAERTGAARSKRSTKRGARSSASRK